MKQLVVTIQSIIDEADDIRTLVLCDATGAELPEFGAGAHVDVFLGENCVRQYSLCGSPSRRNAYEIAVKLVNPSRGGSKAIHALGVNSELTISHPRSNFSLHQSASHSILIGGGIGVTPVLAMAYELAESGRSYELHYFARSSEHVAFRRIFCSHPLGAHVTLHIGVQPDELEERISTILNAAPTDTHLYCCGPMPFMERVIGLAEPALGPSSVHIESFDGANLTVEGDMSFDVELKRSRRRFSIPVGESISSVLEADGIATNISCEQGICGSCITRVLEGIPDHRDSVLSSDEREGGQLMCVCVSRARTPLLVLDL